MADIKIENIVGFTQVAESLNLSKLAEEIPGSKYNPEDVPALIIHFEKPKTVVMLLPNGRVYFTGPKNIEEAHELIEEICKKLNIIGFSTYEKPDIQVKNIIASTDIKRNLNLRAMASSLSKAEYDPKHFPGLIYRPEDPNTVILFFDSGKIVCNISESKMISTAVDKITHELKSIGML
jgi:TATA-box binding protein (TBP) (component of TFIID and TFIIIB)